MYKYLDDDVIINILDKYCKYMPIPIRYQGLNKNFNNISDPLWCKLPKDLKQDDYINLYKELYPKSNNTPLFWIHLNIDYPVKLLGVLYINKNNSISYINKEKIYLYKNRVFITDNVKNIIPEFLNILCGIIQSNNITLNVSRSNLQKDLLIKQFNYYIIKKFLDTLIKTLKSKRDFYIKIWPNIKLIIEYGIITNNYCLDKFKYIYIFKTINNEYYTFDEFLNKIK